eukprot:8507953-Pyramimonas_sp.AAC.1
MTIAIELRCPASALAVVLEDLMCSVSAAAVSLGLDSYAVWRNAGSGVRTYDSFAWNAIETSLFSLTATGAYQSNRVPSARL